MRHNLVSSIINSSIFVDTPSYFHCSGIFFCSVFYVVLLFRRGFFVVFRLVSDTCKWLVIDEKVFSIFR